jgi:hypothetical protein
MLHITLILYLLSLVAASASITGAVVFYFRFRNTALFYYALMLGVVALLLLHRMTELYCDAMNLRGGAIQLILASIEHAAFITGMFAGPLFKPVAADPLPRSMTWTTSGFRAATCSGTTKDTR